MIVSSCRRHVIVDLIWPLDGCIPNQSNVSRKFTHLFQSSWINIVFYTYILKAFPELFNNSVAIKRLIYFVATVFFHQIQIQKSTFFDHNPSFIFGIKHTLNNSGNPFSHFPFFFYFLTQHTDTFMQKNLSNARILNIRVEYHLNTFIIQVDRSFFFDKKSDNPSFKPFSFTWIQISGLNLEKKCHFRLQFTLLFRRERLTFILTSVRMNCFQSIMNI